MNKQISISVVLAATATLAFAQGVLKEQVADNLTTLYIDGGALGGAGAQNYSRIVRVQKWNCPIGATRPASGAVTFVGPPRWIPQEITLASMQCLRPTFDPDTNVETDEIVAMVQAPDDGSYFIATGQSGDRIDSNTSSTNSNAMAAGAAAAAAAGYFNPCSSTAFNLLSAAMPDPKKDPAGYACFMDYAAHAR